VEAPSYTCLRIYRLVIDLIKYAVVMNNNKFNKSFLSGCGCCSLLSGIFLLFLELSLENLDSILHK
jgi:hypothetical protein